MYNTTVPIETSHYGMVHPSVRPSVSPVPVHKSTTEARKILHINGENIPLACSAQPFIFGQKGIASERDDPPSGSGDTRYTVHGLY